MSVAGSNPAVATSVYKRSYSIVGMRSSDKRKIAGSIPAMSICQCNSNWESTGPVNLKLGVRFPPLAFYPEIIYIINF